MIYARAGACIISILTEPVWFQGTLADLTLARIQTTNWAATTSPLGVAKSRASMAKPGHLKGQVRRPAILGKDFVTSEYQIAEAAAAGRV